MLQTMGVYLLVASGIVLYLLRALFRSAFHQLRAGAWMRARGAFDRTLLARRRQVLCDALIGALAIALMLLVATSLLLASSQPHLRSREGGSGSGPAGGVSTAAPAAAPASPVAPVAPPIAPPLDKEWAGFYLTIFVMLVGGVLLFTHSRLAQRVGVVAMVCGLVNGYLFKDIKIDSLAKFEFKPDGIAFNFNKQVNSDLKLEVARQLAGFAPELFDPISGFELGGTEIPEGMGAPIKAICRRWMDQDVRELGGMLLLIGSADRLPLKGPLIGRYESNVGLARARAERVKSRLTRECNIPADRMLTVIAGPANTPGRGQKTDPAGFADDRSVLVWALWNAKSKAIVPVTATAASTSK